MAERKRPLIAVLILPVTVVVIVGLAGLNRVMQSPNFAMYRTVDIVQLLGSGVCFGVAMVLIVMLLRGVRI